MVSIEKNHNLTSIMANSINGNQEQVSTFTVIKATVIKDIINFSRYKQNFIATFVRVLAYILLFYFFSIALVYEDLPSRDWQTLFIFLLSGLSLMMYDGVALWGPYESVQTDLYNGTLESIYLNPSSKYGYYVGGVLAKGVFNTIFVVPLFISLVIFADLSLQNILIIWIVIISVLTTLMALGIIIGLFGILFKQANTIINVLGLLYQFVTGAIIPVASLPTFAQYVGYVIPVTWGLDLIRYYTYNDWTTIYPVHIEWMILGLTLVIFLLISKILLKQVEKYSKKHGLHLI